MTDEKATLILTIMLIAMTLFVCKFDFKKNLSNLVPEPIPQEIKK